MRAESNDTQVDLDGTTVVSLKLKQAMKEKAVAIAKKRGITFTELVRELLDDAIVEDSIPDYKNTIDSIRYFWNIDESDKHPLKLKALFMDACRNEMEAIPCPNCGTDNTPDSTYCKECGAMLNWISPDFDKALAFFDKYKKENILSPEYEFYLSEPASNDPNCNFTILRHKLNSSDYKIAKIIDKDDLKIGEEILKQIKQNKQ